MPKMTQQFFKIQKDLKELRDERDQWEPEDYERSRAGYIEMMKGNSSWNLIWLVPAGAFVTMLGVFVYIVLTSPEGGLNAAGIGSAVLVFFFGFVFVSHLRETIANIRFPLAERRKWIVKMREEGLLSAEEENEILDASNED